MHPGGSLHGHAIASATMDLTPPQMDPCALGEREQDMNALPSETVGTTHQSVFPYVHNSDFRVRTCCSFMFGWCTSK